MKVLTMKVEKLIATIYNSVKNMMAQNVNVSLKPDTEDGIRLGT